MELLFDNPFGNEYDGLLPLYRELAAKTFARLKVSANYEIDVSLVDEETIRTINRDYRKIDRVTDVISFAFNDDTDPRNQINDEKTLRMLGEILICLPQAKRQAADIGNSEKRELSFLFVHGLLHLLGYDHQTQEEEKTMFALQDEILDGGKKDANQ